MPVLATILATQTLLSITHPCQHYLMYGMYVHSFSISMLHISCLLGQTKLKTVNNIHAICITIVVKVCDNSH